MTDAKVTPMLKTLTLENQERLEVENIQLKSQLLDVQRQALMKAQQDWATRVSKRLDVDIAEYNIDITTGNCTKATDDGTDK